MGITRGGMVVAAEVAGLLHLPLDALVAVLLVFSWQKLRRRWRSAGKTPPGAPPTPRWGLLYGYACLGALSHLLLDFTNAYGLRPFMPFSYRWYHWDIVSIIEPVMMVALAGGLALPWLFGLIHEEIGSRHRPSGRGGAIAALAIMGLRSKPKNGKSTPAASGIPSAL